MKVILFYKFTPIANPQEFRDTLHTLSIENQLKGRVLIASEGINGTVSGSKTSVEVYKDFLKQTLGAIDFKEDKITAHAFAKMKTKVRKSILNMGVADQVDVQKHTANHLSPKEWKEVLEKEKDFVLLDVRNNYESKVGRFKNAITPDLKNFHEFPSWVEDLNQFKEKKVLMYCTGGIRCEKFSAFLNQEGFKDVHQLSGGILNYFKSEGAAHFEGSCFVFDDRLGVNPEDPQKKIEPISTCHHCNKLEYRYINCSNMDCNELFVCCDECAKKTLGCCSQKCFDSKLRRPFDEANFRIPFRKKGIEMPQLGRKFSKNNSKKSEAQV